MKKSKVDSIIKRKSAEAKSEGRNAGIYEGQQRAREEFEMLLVPPDDGTGVCVIGGEPPKHNIILVAIYPGGYARPMRDAGDIGYEDMRMRVSRAAFRPVQMCQTFKTGQRVVWYNYQFDGMR